MGSSPAREMSCPQVRMSGCAVALFSHPLPALSICFARLPARDVTFALSACPSVLAQRSQCAVQTSRSSEQRSATLAQLCVFLSIQSDFRRHPTRSHARHSSPRAPFGTRKRAEGQQQQFREGQMLRGLRGEVATRTRETALSTRAARLCACSCLAVPRGPPISVGPYPGTLLF